MRPILEVGQQNKVYRLGSITLPPQIVSHFGRKGAKGEDLDLNNSFQLVSLTKDFIEPV